MQEIHLAQTPDIQVSGKCRVMDKIVKCLFFPEVQALGYFIMLGIRYECSLFS